MRILLLGRTGQLGWELERTLAPLGEIYALGPEELNLTDLEALDQRIHEVHPQIIVNASAYTAVDRAEGQVDLAMRLNAQAPAVMAEAARVLNAPLIHFSTDYVFDGQKDSAYTEDPLQPAQQISPRLPGVHCALPWIVRVLSRCLVCGFQIGRRVCGWQ
jgi:dTDP-4-dehydrorhamnose reductase